MLDYTVSSITYYFIELRQILIQNNNMQKYTFPIYNKTHNITRGLFGVIRFKMESQKKLSFKHRNEGT